MTSKWVLMKTKEDDRFCESLARSFWHICAYALGLGVFLGIIVGWIIK